MVERRRLPVGPRLGDVPERSLPPGAVPGLALASLCSRSASRLGLARRGSSEPTGAGKVNIGDAG
jgi:hypothetical protein